MKSESAIQQMLQAVEKGRIDDWMWLKILEKMYEVNDAQILQERLREMVAVRTRNEPAEQAVTPSQKKMTRQQLKDQMINGSSQTNKLLWTDFKKVILDFQLQEHERFLIKFTNLFKSVDRDQDGVISEVQFQELLRMMNVLEDESEIDALLSKIDPFNNKKMTYSEVVDALSNHMVSRDPLNPSPHNQIALIEKFIQDEEQNETIDGMTAMGQRQELGFLEGQKVEVDDYADEPSEYDNGGQPYIDPEQAA